MGIKNLSSGKIIIDQLRRFGSDLSCKHEISFWLYFPSKNLADRAAHYAGESGLEPYVYPPQENSPDTNCLCLIYCKHIPDESLLDEATKFCINLASEFNGELDGWESRLELE